MQDLARIIKEALAGRKPRAMMKRSSIYRESAVLIPLFKDGAEHKILLTKRTNLVEAHKGQISFPGGMVESADGHFSRTALREAFEEIGLRPEHVTVLGQLDDMLTMASNFIIHPFVGMVPYPYEFRINPQEVAELIHVPLGYLLKEQVVQEPKAIEFEGQVYTGFVYTFEKHVIWGATARIIGNLLEIVRGKI